MTSVEWVPMSDFSYRRVRDTVGDIFKNGTAATAF